MNTSTKTADQAQIEYSDLPDEKVTTWFKNQIENLKTDHALLSAKLLSKDTAAGYATLIANNKEISEIVDLDNARMLANSKNLQNMLFHFMYELFRAGNLPSKLAFDISQDKVYLWAEIENDNESVEDSLIWSEALVNADVYSRGYSVTTTIVEQCDNASVPPHYKSVPINEFKLIWETSRNI